MAIERTGYTVSSFGGTQNTTNTVSHTVSGSNTLLLTFFTIYNSTTDVVTGVTYAGTAMTRVNYAPYPGISPRQMYCYALVSPTSGANNLVISTSAANYCSAGIITYAGCKQVQPEATTYGATANNSSPMTLSVTTLTDNDWVVGAFHGEGTAISASTGSTFVFHIEGTNCDYAEYSSNAKTPAGSASMAYNVATANNWPSLGILTAFAPFVTAAGPTPLIHRIKGRGISH